MESTLSNQMEASLPNGAPAPPVIAHVAFKEGKAVVAIDIPTVDADGGPLTGLKTVYLFVKETSFEGSTPEQERVAGTPVFSLDISNITGGRVHIFVPDTVYGKTYYFVASCDD